MHDQEVVKVRFKVVGHGGVVTDAAILLIKEDIQAVFDQYKSERRDQLDPFAFLEYCVVRYKAKLVLPYQAKYLELSQKATEFKLHDKN